MANWQPRITASGQRLSLTLTTTPLLPASGAALEFSGLGQLGHLIAVATDAPAWVTFYASAAAREADGVRPAAVDPLPGSGVLLDVATTPGALVIHADPGCLYFQAQATTTPVLRALVRNTGSTQVAIAVTLTAVVLVP